MDGEDAVLVEQRLGQRDIVLVRRAPAQPERGDRAVERRIFGRQNLNLRQVAHGVHPAIAQRPQACRRAERRRCRLEREGVGNGQLGGIVGRAGMDARDGCRLLFGFSAGSGSIALIRSRRT